LFAASNKVAADNYVEQAQVAIQENVRFEEIVSREPEGTLNIPTG